MSCGPSYEESMRAKILEETTLAQFLNGIKGTILRAHGKRSQSRRCYNGNRVGHLAKHCREPSRDKCGNCGQDGHKAEVCCITKCKYCNKVEHLQSSCFKKKNLNKKGHMSEPQAREARNRGIRAKCSRKGGEKAFQVLGLASPCEAGSQCKSEGNKTLMMYKEASVQCELVGSRAPSDDGGQKFSPRVMGNLQSINESPKPGSQKMETNVTMQ
ncbi:hypothetical protein PR048_013208 [Dryococelus australis]|uniref:CCHC-type domain-containing protein n=1 Tax=Dryococelus australis TaxID=614101 RepID=A0ABQ9HRJ5_9NEOP|nr:hypothetical protein PR048_013208 [Dryococelus australis]